MTSLAGQASVLLYTRDNDGGAFMDRILGQTDQRRQKDGGKGTTKTTHIPDTGPGGYKKSQFPQHQLGFGRAGHGLHFIFIWGLETKGNEGVDEQEHGS